MQLFSSVDREQENHFLAHPLLIMNVRCVLPLIAFKHTGFAKIRFATGLNNEYI